MRRWPRFHTLVWMTITVGFLASTTAARAAGTRCATDAHHQFDFWLGEWEVRRNDAAAPVVGHNTIARIDGCTLLESWRGADGGTGHSMNAYDAASRSWRQFWVGSGCSANCRIRKPAGRQDSA